MAKVELQQPIVDEIKASLEGAQGVVVVDYRGLTVEQDTQLRKQLREAGVSPGMIRLSVGIESAKDIINDLKEALENAQFYRCLKITQ